MFRIFLFTHFSSLSRFCAFLPLSLSLSVAGAHNCGSSSLFSPASLLRHGVTAAAPPLSLASFSSLTGIIHSCSRSRCGISSLSHGGGSSLSLTGVVLLPHAAVAAVLFLFLFFIFIFLYSLLLLLLFFCFWSRRRWR